MKAFVRFLFAAAIIALSCLALLGLLPYAETGFTQDLLPTLLGGIATFPILGLLWWFAVERNLLKALPLWIVLTIPALAYIWAAIGLL